MASVDLRKLDGSVVRSIDLDDAMFGVQPNVPLMHQVVTAQLAAARSGTQSTKTRAEVSGGGAKPFRQKGTGRARQGSTRAPHWSGGGVALGPKPRSYKQRTPKKMIAASLRSALSDRAADGHVAVVEHWNFDAPRTKDAKAALSALGLEGRVLIVVDRDDENAFKSFRNLTEVQLILSDELNTYDVLCSDWIVFSERTLPGGATETTASSTPAAAATAATAAPVAEPAEAAEPATPAATTVTEPAVSVDVADDTAADETEAGDIEAVDTDTDADTDTDTDDDSEETSS